MRKDTKSWAIKYKDDRGKWRHKTIGKRPKINKGIAKEILLKIERRIKLGQFEMVEQNIPTLNEITPLYIQHQESNQKRSIKEDKRHLRELSIRFGNAKLTQISSEDIDNYKKDRRRKVKPSSINRELATLKHLFNLAKRWKKYFGENPVSEAGLLLEDNIIERILTVDEEERLLANSPRYLHNIIVCALNTGMRIGEIISLRWDNVNLDARTITIDKNNSKNKKTQKIPVNSKLRMLLLKLKIKCPEGEKYVFLNSKNKPYKKSDSLNNVFRCALKSADISGLRFHDLRHTAATRMIENGASIVSVSKILRHSDLKTTMRYMHPDNSLIDAVESLTHKLKPEADGNGFGNVKDST